MDIDLNKVRVLYFTGQALVHVDSQGKDYLRKVEVSAELDSDNRIVVNSMEDVTND